MSQGSLSFTSSHCAGSMWLRCRRRATPWRSSLARTSSASSFDREIFACRVALKAWLHGLSTGSLRRNCVHQTQPTKEKILYVCLLYALLYGCGYCMAIISMIPCHSFFPCGISCTNSPRPRFLKQGCGRSPRP